jgi:3-phenylpropionate/cinnamic acid dioxygenase small subunit
MTDSNTELANLISRYAELIDAGDFDGVSELLGDAAVGAGDSTSLLRGAQAIRGLFTSTTRLHPDGTPGTKHVTTNLIVHIDDDGGTATARSYFTVLQAAPGLPLQPILAGRYHDRFERGDGGWRFAERRYLVDLVGDVSHHMITELPS